MSEKYKIIPMFTFDQPIWWKARQLKNQDEGLSTIVLNLGAFHTDMSFFGGHRTHHAIIRIETIALFGLSR